MSTACPFVWYELMSTDPAAAAAFYSRVVGWKVVDAGMPMPYSLLGVGEHHVGGLMGMPQDAPAGMPPVWTGYVGVADVDAAAARFQAAGGQICRPAEDIPGVGRFAVVSDPQGATLCLYTDKSGSAPQGPAPGTPGTVGWHELLAADGAAALAFYAQQFGWTAAEAIDMGPMGTYQLFAAGGDPIGGMMTKPPEMPVPAWGFYFNVPAIDAAVERIESGGGKVVNGPMQVPGGSWIVNSVDPQGGMFSLVAPQR